MRIAEEDDEDLSVDAALLEHLGAMGVRVPRVVHVDPFRPALGPLGAGHDRDRRRAPGGVPRPAGRPPGRSCRRTRPWPAQPRGGAGFGWIRRRPPAWPPRATSPTYAEFVNGDYRGLIDFGEIRGTEPLFDLGHFTLWEDGARAPLLADLLAGYGEVAVLPSGPEQLIGRSAILRLRQLARWLGPPRRLARGHPMVTDRVARLHQLLGGPAHPSGLR